MSIAEQAANFDQLNNLYRLQVTLDLMRKNLLLFNKDPNAQIVTVSNTSLYKLAENYYKDSTKWTAIAKANGLTDPQITDTLVLLIPNVPEDQGGILKY